MKQGSPIRPRNQYFLIAGWMVFLLSGCAYHTPQDDLQLRVPGTWSSASKGQEKAISTGWLNDFYDPKLKQAVATALLHNQSLKAAAARMRSAKEDTIIARSSRLPRFNIGTDGSC